MFELHGPRASATPPGHLWGGCVGCVWGPLTFIIADGHCPTGPRGHARPPPSHPLLCTPSPPVGGGEGVRGGWPCRGLGGACQGASTAGQAPGGPKGGGHTMPGSLMSSVKSSPKPDHLGTCLAPPSKVLFGARHRAPRVVLESGQWQKARDDGVLCSAALFVRVYPPPPHTLLQRLWGHMCAFPLLLRTAAGTPCPPPPPSHTPPHRAPGRSLRDQIFFLLRTALKVRPKGPPTANRQPPPTANRQPLPTINRCQPPPTTHHQLPTTANRRQPPTANQQSPPTANRRQPPTANQQSPPTANRRQPPTANRQPSISTNRQPPTGNLHQPPTANRHQRWLNI